MIAFKCLAIAFKCRGHDRHETSETAVEIKSLRLQLLAYSLHSAWLSAPSMTYLQHRSHISAWKRTPTRICIYIYRRDIDNYCTYNRVTALSRWLSWSMSYLRKTCASRSTISKSNVEVKNHRTTRDLRVLPSRIDSSM